MTATWVDEDQNIHCPHNTTTDFEVSSKLFTRMVETLSIESPIGANRVDEGMSNWPLLRSLLVIQYRGYKVFPKLLRISSIRIRFIIDLHNHLNPRSDHNGSVQRNVLVLNINTRTKKKLVVDYIITCVECTINYSWYPIRAPVNADSDKKAALRGKSSSHGSYYHSIVP